MKPNVSFDYLTLETLIGGLATLDVPRLNIQNLEQAKAFIKTYGYDMEQEKDISQLWSYHRRAVTFIRTELLRKNEDIPEILSDPNQLKDLAYLLIYASTQDQREDSLQRWACAILKVMHVLVHLDNDLFTFFSSEIQNQILKPLQDSIHTDPVSGIKLGMPKDRERIALKKFEVKPLKTSNSSITKLLAKPEAVAFSILDKMGVRFVTKHLFDAFRVMRFLIDNNLVSFAHMIPDQSNNTLYPVNLFTEVMESITKDMDLKAKDIDEMLAGKLREAGQRAQFRAKINQFSSKDYRFIKFITRRLIRVESGDKPLSFFYPYEIQILDYETYLKNLSGPASHEEYKTRQREKARVRVLGGGEPVEE